MFLLCFVKEVLSCFDFAHLNVLTFSPLTGGCSEGLDASSFFFKKLHAEWEPGIGVYTQGVGGVGGGGHFKFVLAVARWFAQPSSRTFSGGRFVEEQSADFSRGDGRDGNMVMGTFV